MITFTIPVKTSNPLNLPQGNSRLAAIIRTQRRAKERNAARLCFRAAHGVLAGGRIKLTRLSAGTMDAHDGLRAALKGIVDGICDELGVKDNDPRLTFQYEQKKCKRGTYGVEVVIT